MSNDMNKRAELKYLHSPDLPDLEDAKPQDPADFVILVQAIIGLEGGDGADTFDFIVCTPKWLERQVTPENPMSGRSHIFVEHYDYEQIRSEIARYCSLAVGPSWPSVAAILSRYGRWEYEDAAKED
jgi:hypothetical protein